MQASLLIVYTNLVPVQDDVVSMQCGIVAAQNFLSYEHFSLQCPLLAVHVKMPLTLHGVILYPYYLHPYSYTVPHYMRKLCFSFSVQMQSWCELFLAAWEEYEILILSWCSHCRRHRILYSLFKDNATLQWEDEVLLLLNILYWPNALRSTEHKSVTKLLPWSITLTVIIHKPIPRIIRQVSCLEHHLHCDNEQTCTI